MGNIVVFNTMSLDGFIAHHDDSVDPLFAWYGNGGVAIAGGDPERVFHTSRASADWIERYWRRVGVNVVGRHLFDHTDGWGGRPPAGEHVVVVTRRPSTDWQERFPDAPFTFVDGVAPALERARALAGERDVALSAGDVAGQAFAAGLVDELDVGIVPVVFGSGKRYFGDFAGPPALLDDPYDVVLGERIVHMRYRM